jgi:hypothetical protein
MIMKTFPLQKWTAVWMLAAALVFPGASVQAETSAPPDSLGDFQQVAPGQGWLLFGGGLYWTNDDGAAWTDITPDTSASIEAVTFLDAARGHALLADASGYALASTTDGGAAWQATRLDFPEVARADSPVANVFMEWQSESQGWLSFKLATGSNFDRRLSFVTRDGGVTWQAVSGGEVNRNSGQSTVWKEAGMSAVVMSTSAAGWARWESGQCAESVCVREVKLMTTRDGGAVWSPVSLPNGMNSLRENFSTPKFSDADAQPYAGQGFDQCEVASLAQLQNWWNNSPYNAVNLYIGGISRACANASLSASFVSQANAQGWRFIPTWVGLQASCSAYSHRMSSDAVTARAQGVEEADAAIAVAQSLGLANADGSGTVIYLDLEAYNTSNAECRNAANAFVDGWTSEMQAKGNLAGVYGASCGSAPTDWWSLASVPDALWIANWYGNAGTVSYTRTATVWDAACLSNSLWPTHQRLRQYAGDHNETWGSLTLNIDSNVLDGTLAVPDGSANLAAPSAPDQPSPVNGAAFDTANDTWLSWKTNGDTCSVHIWATGYDVTAPDNNCSLYHLGVLPVGSYSWQVTAANGFGATVGPTWHFTVQPVFAPPELLSPANGEILLTRRPAFDWTDVTGAVSYTVQLSKLLGFTPVYKTVLVASSTVTYPRDLPPGTLFYWRVRANKLTGSSAWSATRSFTTANPPSKPALVSPRNISIIKDLTPRFVWKTVTLPVGTTFGHYQLQVAADLFFKSIIIDHSVVAYAAPEHTSAYVLTPGTRYYWRVMACNSLNQCSPWSALRAFKTAADATALSEVDVP